MDSIWIYIAAFCLAWVFGYIHATLDISRKLQKAIEDFETQNIELQNKTFLHNCLVEKYNNTLYMYDKNSNDFICQGSTLDELADNALKYKNVEYAMVESNKNVILFERGKVKT